MRHCSFRWDCGVFGHDVTVVTFPNGKKRAYHKKGCPGCDTRVQQSHAAVYQALLRDSLRRGR